MDILYDYKKSLKDLAKETGFSEKAVSNHFNRLGYNYSKDRAEYLHRAIRSFIKKNPSATIKDIGKEFGIRSHNTIKKYRSDDFVYEDKSKRKQSKKTAPILSVGNSDHIILHNILKLYCPKEATFSCDLTIGKGGFYKRGIKLPDFRFDKNYYGEKSLVGPEVKSLDEAYNLLPDSSLKSIVIDPPSKIDPNNTDYDSFRKLEEVVPECQKMIDLSYKKLKKGGIMIIKTQDFVLRNDATVRYDGQWVADSLIDYACGDLRFQLIDKFILVINNEIMTALSQRMKNIAKYAVFLVLKKSKDEQIKKV